MARPDFRDSSRVLFPGWIVSHWAVITRGRFRALPREFKIDQLCYPSPTAHENRSKKSTSWWDKFQFITETSEMRVNRNRSNRVSLRAPGCPGVLSSPAPHRACGLTLNPWWLLIGYGHKHFLQPGLPVRAGPLRTAGSYTANSQKSETKLAKVVQRSSAFAAGAWDSSRPRPRPSAPGSSGRGQKSHP